MSNTKKVQQQFQSTLIQDGWVSSSELSQLLQKVDAQNPLDQVLLESGILSIQDIQKVWNKVRHETVSRRRFGKYEIIEPIARGAMGLIYKVRHQDLEQVYALKVILSSEATTDELTLERFYREARTTAKLKHPNIVHVVDFGESNRQPYLVMEYLEGKTLEEIIEQGLSLENGLSLMKKILKGLQYAHEQGVLHRDLKPENIFITASGEPKIGDFGLAKDLEMEAYHQLTIAGEILGTPSYMAPEQAAGETQTLDCRADIYSAGACLYRILTRRCPFESDSLPKLFYQIIAEDPLPPSQYYPRIHPDLDAIVLKALEKSKEKRYASAKEFAQDLEHFEKGYPITARPYGLRERLYKRIQRHQKILLAMLSLLFFLSAGVFYFQWKQRASKQQHRTTLLQEAKNLKTQTLQHTLPLQQKFKYLSISLDKLNTALSLFPQDSFLEQQKQETLKMLLQVAMETKEYDLAMYLAREISELSHLQEKEKNKFTQHVEEEKNRQLQAHWTRLEHWLTKFKEGGIPKEERDNALFEISRMAEPEIQQKLKDLLNEGTNYFLDDQNRSITEDHFYQTIALLLGYSGQISAGEVLFQNLKKLSQKVSQVQQQQNVWSDTYFVQYMITLTQALGTLQVPQLAQEIQMIRLLFGKGSIYWVGTEGAYLRLQEAELSSSK